MAILSITIVISFYLRSFIINLWDLDYTAIQDFFLVGFIISFVRPLVTDLFAIYFPLNYLSNFGEDLSLPKKDIDRNRERFERSRGHYGRKRPHHNNNYNNYNNNSNINNHMLNDPDNLELREKIKRKFLWTFWKKYLNNSTTYEQFKKDYNKDVNIRSEIKKDLEIEYPETFRRSRKIIWLVQRFNRKK